MPFGKPYEGHLKKTILEMQWLLICAALAVLIACEAPDAQRQTEAPPANAVATAAAVDVVDLEPIEVVPVEQALITFLVGDVWIERAEGEMLAEIGETFLSGETLSTTDGYAELQVGTLGTLRIQEHSVVRLDDIVLSLGASHVDLRVVQGGLLNRVERLAAGESYRVRTETAVMGVRGTQFRVFVGEDQQTRLAVGEGRVAVLPPAADGDALRRRAEDGEDPEVIEAAIQALEAGAPIIEADQEAAFTLSNVESGSVAIAQLDTVLEELAAAETDATAATEAIRAAVERSMTAIVADTDRSRTEISAESRAELLDIEEVRVLPVVAQEEERTILVPVTLTVEPADARVVLNGSSVGAGRLSALFAPGESVEFTIRADGYRDETLRLTVDPERGREYRVRLTPTEETPGAAEEGDEPTVSETEPPLDEETASEVAALSQETVPLTVTSQPSDAVVRFDGRTVGNGSASERFVSGASVSVEVTRPGYADFTRTVRVEGAEVELAVQLEARPIEREIAVASTSLVRGLVSDGSAAYGADRDGTVYAIAVDGTVLWRVATANERNENSAPVVARGIVAFSGAGELVFIRAADGVVVGRRTLSGGEAHLFGRRALPVAGDWLLPSDEALIPISSGGVETGAPITLPDGSHASAAVADDTIVTMDRNGAAIIINAATGGIQATIATTASQPIALAPAIGGGLAYYMGRRGVAVAIELETQSVAWERTIAAGRGSFVDPVWAAGMVFYLVDNTAIAVEARTGAERYTLSDAAGVPVPMGEHLFYATTDGELRRIDPVSGRTTARVVLSAAATGAPTTVGERIFVPVADGRVTVIHPVGL
ncbi:MAG: PQQ-binding-like beta-propeller repeat protein [Spirochaetales bacterium]|nr:PQQ-binding-like beta-propeller repeat protein [Spirochaetales bacterium]